MNVIAFGAHPDDCDIRVGGTAAKFVKRGDRVKFVSLTNGDAGHHMDRPEALAARRRAEAEEAGRRLGVEYEVLDSHDGELLPTLEVRRAVIRRIREWNADLVISHRPNDYHADHRYGAAAVQDAAYLVMVPHLCPDVAPLRKNPVFAYVEDRFRTPTPFRADVTVDIADVYEQKMDALEAHVSQFYEWLPWVEGTLDQVPSDPAERRRWLGDWLTARGFSRQERFELCEYGSQLQLDALREMFP